MRRSVAFVFAALLLSILFNCGFGAGPTRALASSGDEMALSPTFRAVLIAAGADKDNNGSITVQEMKQLPTTLLISGSDITDITGIGYAVNLTSLTITSTAITTLPAELSNLTKLTSLEISYNFNLNSSGLPASLWTMTSLVTLDLKMNSFSSLPNDIGGLTNLQELNLYHNGLTALPGTIGSLTNLTNLNLQQNDITSLPDSIGNLTKLTELTVWQNQLSSLPDSIGSLTALQELDLDGNVLTSLPGSLKNLTALKKLVLSGNRLTSLPEGIFDNMHALSSLDGLDVEDNYLDPQPGSPDRAEIDVAKANGVSVSYTSQNSYAVTLNYNGGSGAALAKTNYYYGETIALPTAAKTGCVFTGWDWTGDGAADGKTMTVTPNPLTTAAIPVKAIYGYSVTFRTQGFGTIGGGTADIVQNLNAGEHINAIPDIAAKTGYVSLGWYDGTLPVTNADILAMNLTGNKIFVAKYEAEGTIHFTDSTFAAALASATPSADRNGDGFITTGEMKLLTALDLSGKSFTDMTGLEQATNLQSLSLANCGMTSLQNVLGSLPSLKTLNLANNKFAAFPTVLSSMTGLTSLNLSGNLLTTLPTGCLSNLTALTSLNLSGNYLNPGSMPSAVPLAFTTVSPQKSYTIITNFNGGTGTALARSAYYYGEQVTLPKATKTGYDIIGWDTNGDGKTDIANGGTLLLAFNPPQSVTSVTCAAIYKSSNAKLSAIGLSAGARIAPAFSPTVTTYTVTLYDYVGSVTVTPVKADAKATMRINGAAVANVTVPIASSSAKATIPIKVTANDGVTVLTYTLNIVRAAAANLNLSGITLTSGVTRTPAFSPTVTAYTVLLPATMSSVTVTAAKASSLSTLTIDGLAVVSRSFALTPGGSKVVQIKVSAPLATDKTKIYTLTFRRGVTATAFTAIPKIGTQAALSPGGSNLMTISYTMGGPGAVKLEVYKGGKWIALLTRTETTAGAKTWAWDGKVSGVYLPVASYQLRITPTAWGITGPATTITVKIVKYPTVTWQALSTTFRATGTVRTLCAFKVDNPTNAAVRVYNASGKWVATVKSISNLLPSATYTTVTWDGKATAGNTAALKSGTLAPIGTYTIRITVGAKVYSKTIKITR